MKGTYKSGRGTYRSNFSRDTFLVDKVGYDNSLVLKNQTTDYEAGVSFSQWPLPTNILPYKTNVLLGYWGMESQLASSLVSLRDIGGPIAGGATRVRAGASLGAKALVIGLSAMMAASEPADEIVFRTDGLRFGDYAPGGSPYIQIASERLRASAGDLILCFVMSKYTTTGSGLPPGFTLLRSTEQIQIGYTYYDPNSAPVYYTTTSGGNEVGLMMNMVAIGGTTIIDVYSQILIHTFDTDAAG